MTILYYLRYELPSSFLSRRVPGIGVQIRQFEGRSVSQCHERTYVRFALGEECQRRAARNGQAG